MLALLMLALIKPNAKVLRSNFTERLISSRYIGPYYSIKPKITLLRAGSLRPNYILYYIHLFIMFDCIYVSS